MFVCLSRSVLLLRPRSFALAHALFFAYAHALLLSLLLSLSLSHSPLPPRPFPLSCFTSLLPFPPLQRFLKRYEASRGSQPSSARTTVAESEAVAAATSTRAAIAEQSVAYTTAAFDAANRTSAANEAEKTRGSGSLRTLTRNSIDPK